MDNEGDHRGSQQPHRRTGGDLQGQQRRLVRRSGRHEDPQLPQVSGYHGTELEYSMVEEKIVIWDFGTLHFHSSDGQELPVLM